MALTTPVEPAVRERSRVGLTPIRASQLTLGQLLSECVAALVAKPGRSALTALGVLLGVGTFVTVVGLANTASGQISARFDALAATTVTATDARQAPDATFPFPADTDRRVRALNGVTGAGVMWHLPVEAGRVAGSPTSDGLSTLDVYAVSSGIWDVVEPHLAQGRVYDQFAEQHRQRVVVLGASIANRLGITTLATRPAITIDHVGFTVVGIIDDAVRDPELLLSVAIPRATAELLWGRPSANTASLKVATRVGAANQIAHEIPAAVAPTQMKSISVTPPPDPRQLRDDVSNDLGSLLIGLALICLFVGAVGIANTTLVAVVERTAEIGLRRALGARRRQIAAQVMCESAVLGGIGGLIGTSVGVLIVLAVALTRDWTAVMSPALTISSPLIGLVVGSLAGLYPAIRAARIEPTEALRR
jgi:putative ABC transport system permease protein